MRRGGDERIRLTGLVFIVVVLVVRLVLEATNGAVPLRSYALVNLGIAVGVAVTVAAAYAYLPRAAAHPSGHRRVRAVGTAAAVRSIARKRDGSGAHTIHLN